MKRLLPLMPLNRGNRGTMAYSSVFAEPHAQAEHWYRLLPCSRVTGNPLDSPIIDDGRGVSISNLPTW